MSSLASSYYTSSLGEQTIFAYQDGFVTQENPTDAANVADVLSYDYTSAYTFQQLSAPSNDANLGSPVANFIAEEHEESDLSYAQTSRSENVDWQFLYDFTGNLDIKFNDHDFYEDADASLHSTAAIYAAPLMVAMVAGELEFDDSLYDNAEQLDYTDIEEVSQNSDARSHTSYSPAGFIHQENLLNEWQWDLQRHEWVALKFQYPPYTTERR